MRLPQQINVTIFNKYKSLITAKYHMAFKTIDMLNVCSEQINKIVLSDLELLQRFSHFTFHMFYQLSIHII